MTTFHIIITTHLCIRRHTGAGTLGIHRHVEAIGLALIVVRLAIGTAHGVEILGANAWTRYHIGFAFGLALIVVRLAIGTAHGVEILVANAWTRYHLGFAFGLALVVVRLAIGTAHTVEILVANAWTRYHTGFAFGLAIIVVRLAIGTAHGVVRCVANAWAWLVVLRPRSWSSSSSWRSCHCLCHRHYIIFHC